MVEKLDLFRRALAGASRAIARDGDVEVVFANDIGAGSGSIGIEWLLSHPANRAIAIEADPARAARVRANADALGADRLQLVTGSRPERVQTICIRHQRRGSGQAASRACWQSAHGSHQECE